MDQGRSSVYGFIEPQTIQPSGNSHDDIKLYLQNGWLSQIERSTLHNTLMRKCFC